MEGKIINAQVPIIQEDKKEGLPEIAEETRVMLTEEKINKLLSNGDATGFPSRIGIVNKVDGYLYAVKFGNVTRLLHRKDIEPAK